MKRVVAVAAVLAAGALAGACAGDAAVADVTRQSLSVKVNDGKASVLEIVDLGAEGFGTGDQLNEVAPVEDETGTTIGNTYTLLSILGGTAIEDATGVIDCHVVLDRGSIMFHGFVATKSLGAGIELPVTGGTGAYAGAGGVLKMQAPDAKTTNLTFDLLLPKVTDEGE